MCRKSTAKNDWLRNLPSLPYTNIATLGGYLEVQIALEDGGEVTRCPLSKAAKVWLRRAREHGAARSRVMSAPIPWLMRCAVPYDCRQMLIELLAHGNRPKGWFAKSRLPHLGFVPPCRGLHSYGVHVWAALLQAAVFPLSHIAFLEDLSTA